MAAGWSNMDEVMDDLYTLSDYGVNKIRAPSEHVRKARTKAAALGARRPGRRQSSSDSEEEVAKLPPLRGRPVNNNQYRAPGGLPAQLRNNHEEETKRKLRQVTGFGASNELIVKIIKMNNSDEADPAANQALADISESIRLRPKALYNSNSSSSGSSKSSSVRNNYSFMSDDKRTRKPTVTEPVAAAAAPVLATRQVNKPEKQTTNNGSLLNPLCAPFVSQYFNTADDAQKYDIDSKADFPAL